MLRRDIDEVQGLTPYQCLCFLMPYIPRTEEDTRALYASIEEGGGRGDSNRHDDRDNLERERRTRHMSTEDANGESRQHRKTRSFPLQEESSEEEEHNDSQ